ncbi:flagellar hook-associated protein 3 [Endozoicomonas sp. OPT23]|uniref:flagellar hook-associated protein FlgL n=1 Tax=Endozoicomonas sp. OPT23 TaxID=2072845 RepID=UPI00129BF5C9|nr:flagellar hook-associated protein FlgL [Endozoicomonas sp. OPT23]MRI33923.1 flagellar hook-associated protein 3 [Endozoicomonas sp. OPT23]
MRVSTLQLNSNMQFNMNSTSTSMNKLLVQMSSGKRILSPSDDVLASNQLLGLQDDIGRLENHKKNIDSSKNALSLTETSMKEMGNVMNRVRDLVLATGSAAQDRTDSANLQEIKLLVGNLRDLANTKAGSGEHIFAGTQGDKAPVSETAGKHKVGGTDDVRKVQVSDSQKVKLGTTVKDLFNLDIEAAPGTDKSDFNDSVDTSNIFNALEEFVTRAGDKDLSDDDFKEILANTIEAVDQSQGQMNRGLTEIGASMKTLELAADSNSEMQTFNKSLISSLEDVDMAKATSEFAIKKLQLEAGQKAFAMVSKINLFNFI